MPQNFSATEMHMNSMIICPWKQNKMCLYRLVHIMKESTGFIKKQKKGVDLELSYKNSWNFNGSGNLPMDFLHNCLMELLFICLNGCHIRVAVH
jgi:hypothetical protein